jgi:cytochrome oxidase assembly protein ShyY1
VRYLSIEFADLMPPDPTYRSISAHQVRGTVGGIFVSRGLCMWQLVRSRHTEHWLAAASCSCLSPPVTVSSVRQMRDFYGPGWDGYYRIVSARSWDIVKACKMDEPG